MVEDKAKEDKKGKNTKSKKVEKELLPEPKKEEIVASEVEKKKTTPKKKKVKEVKEEVKEVVKEEVKEVKVEAPVIEEPKVEVTPAPAPVVPVTSNITPIVPPVYPNVPQQVVVNNQVYTLPESYFDGGMFQLIGWTILGTLITIITLGLGYPFALTLILKWQYKHTVINGRRCYFDGSAWSLFGHWLLWMFLSIITLGIYTIFLPVRINKWVVSHVHYQDSTYKNSMFVGTTLQYIGWVILGSIISVITLFIAYPVAICFLYRWRINHTIIDGDQMEFDGKGLDLLGHMIIWTLLTIVTLGLYSFYLPIAIVKWEVKHTNRKGVSKKPFNPLLAVIGPLLFFIVACGGTFAICYFFKDDIVAQLKKFENKTNEKKNAVWGDTYFKEIKDSISGEARFAFVDFFNDDTPELIVLNSDRVVIYNITDNEVSKSRKYTDSTVEVLYEINTGNKVWAIKENVGKYNNYYFVSNVISNKKPDVDINDKDIKEFNSKYIIGQHSISYLKLDSDNIKDDFYDGVKNYNKSNALSNEDDAKNKEYLDEIIKKNEKNEKAKITIDNYEEKVGDNIKWFIGAYQGANSGWQKVITYKEVSSKKVPYSSSTNIAKKKWDDYTFYQLEDVKSIEELVNKTNEYVSSKVMNKLNSRGSKIGSDLHEIDGKVYWITKSNKCSTKFNLNKTRVNSSEDGVTVMELYSYNCSGDTSKPVLKVTIVIEYDFEKDKYTITNYDERSL